MVFQTYYTHRDRKLRQGIYFNITQVLIDSPKFRCLDVREFKDRMITDRHNRREKVVSVHRQQLLYSSTCSVTLSATSTGVAILQLESSLSLSLSISVSTYLSLSLSLSLLIYLSIYLCVCLYPFVYLSDTHSLFPFF